MKNSIWAFMVLFTFLGCQKEDKVMEEFKAFYDNFHRDTVFQLEHIIFPLEGLPPGGDSLMAINQKYYWQKDSWVCHKPFDFEYSEFTQQFIQYSDDLIAEKIEHNTGSYGMLRRFAKFDDDWFLIYYAAANRLKPKPKINIEGGF